MKRLFITLGALFLLLFSGGLAFAEEEIKSVKTFEPAAKPIEPEMDSISAEPVTETVEPVEPASESKPVPVPEPEFTIVRSVREGYVFEVDSVYLATVEAVDGGTALKISGECGDTYYVILLFRGAEDYAANPRSYLVNRAYPCEAGGFSYRLTDDGKLPTNLDGTYYLIIGEEGETGLWRAVSEAIQVQIKKEVRVTETKVPVAPKVPVEELLNHKDSVVPSGGGDSVAPRDEALAPTLTPLGNKPAEDKPVPEPVFETPAPPPVAEPVEVSEPESSPPSPTDTSATDTSTWRRLKQILVALLDFVDQRLVYPALAKVR